MWIEFYKALYIHLHLQRQNLILILWCKTRGVPVCVDPYSLLSFGQDNVPLAAAAKTESSLKLTYSYHKAPASSNFVLLVRQLCRHELQNMTKMGGKFPKMEGSHDFTLTIPNMRITTGQRQVRSIPIKAASRWHLLSQSRRVFMTRRQLIMWNTAVKVAVEECELLSTHANLDEQWCKDEWHGRRENKPHLSIYLSNIVNHQIL